MNENEVAIIVVGAAGVCLGLFGTIAWIVAMYLAEKNNDGFWDL